MLFLGDISLTFYLIHAIPLHYLMDRFSFVHIPRRTGQAVGLNILCWTLTLPAAWLVAEYFEKPIARAIVRRLPGQAARPPK